MRHQKVNQDNTPGSKTQAIEETQEHITAIADTGASKHMLTVQAAGDRKQSSLQPTTIEFPDNSTTIATTQHT